MNQQLIVKLEVVKGDNKYCMCIPMGAPLGEAYDAAFEFLKHLTEMSKQAVDQVKPVEPVAAEVVGE